VRGPGWRAEQDNRRRLEVARTLAHQLHGLSVTPEALRAWCTAGPETPASRLEDLRVLLSSKGTAEVELQLTELGLSPKRVPHPRDVDGPGTLEVVVDLTTLEGGAAQLHRTVVPGEDVALALVRAGQGAVALHGPDITLTRAYLQWVGYSAEEVPR